MLKSSSGMSGENVLRDCLLQSVSISESLVIMGKTTSVPLQAAPTDNADSANMSFRQ